MNERLKKLRKHLDLTQQEFAERIGSKRNTIAKYETNTNVPSAAVISLICREFNVNEEWLREGTGKMFIERSRSQIITDFADDLIKEPDSFKKKLFEGLAQLDEKDWEAIEQIVIKLSNNNSSSNTSNDIYADVPDTAEELERMYPPVELDNADVG